MTAPRIVVDSIGATSHNIPTTTPTVAYYLTGGPGIEWTAAELDRLAGSTRIPIDQSNDLDPVGDVDDVESGACTIPTAIIRARARAAQRRPTTIYIQGSRFAALRASVAAAGLQGDVYYWVANWSLSELEAAAMLGGRVVAVQFASPSSNPLTLLPGSGLTLRAANCDLSVAVEDWHPVVPQPQSPVDFPTPTPPARRRVHPKVAGSTAGAAIGAGITALLKAAGVPVDGAEAGAITTIAALLAGTLTPSGRR